jgi:hypothetical protein
MAEGIFDIRMALARGLFHALAVNDLNPPSWIAHRLRLLPNPKVLVVKQFCIMPGKAMKRALEFQ